MTTDTLDEVLAESAPKLVGSQADLLALALSGRALRVQTINLHHIALTRTDVDFARALRSATHTTADGWPFSLALRVAGVRANRVTGSQLVRDILKSPLDGRRVGLLGGSDETGSKFRELVTAAQGELVYAEHGDRSDWRIDSLVNELNHARVETLLVAVTPPAGDVIAAELLEAGFRGATFSVGGAVDMAVGSRRPAPRWAQTAGVEWLYRLAQEPRRLGKRYFLDCVPALPPLFLASLRQSKVNSSRSGAK